MKHEDPWGRSAGWVPRRENCTHCAGWPGKVGRDFDKVINVLASAVAANNSGIEVSLLCNLDRKGGAAVIMRHQFWRAVGVAIVRGNTKLKLL